MFYVTMFLIQTPDFRSARAMKVLMISVPRERKKNGSIGMFVYLPMYQETGKMQSHVKPLSSQNVIMLRPPARIVK